MACFVVRVELYTADESDYEPLHAAMTARGFARRIPCNVAGEQFPPAADYFIEGNLSEDEVLDRAKGAVNETGQFYSILIDEIDETEQVSKALADTDSHKSLPTVEKPALA
jgi:hypothetical protein